MRFDSLLVANAEKKGVVVRERQRVTGLLRDGERVIGVRCGTPSQDKQVDIRSKYVIDASGHGSEICREVGERVFSEHFRNIAVFGYFKGGKRLPPPNSGNILCCAFPRGWLWYIPLSPHLTSVGAVIGKENTSVLNGGREGAFMQLIAECRPIAEMLLGAERVTDGTYGEVRVRRDFSYCHTEFWRPGVALIGDAACFIDPVFSSGVHLATYSGMLAARSVNAVLSGTVDEQRAFREFERRYRREYGLFYDFLVAFYDVDQDLDSYYWSARKVLNSPEAGNEAFIRLVGGIAGPEEPLFGARSNVFETRAGSGNVLFPAAAGRVRDVEAKDAVRQGLFLTELMREGASMQAQAMVPNAPRKPALPGGLIPSKDGLLWQEPGR
jgi:halogenation protein CepH